MITEEITDEKPRLQKISQERGPGMYSTRSFLRYWNSFIKEGFRKHWMFSSITFSYKVYTRPNWIQDLFGWKPSKIVTYTLTANDIKNFWLYDDLDMSDPFSMHLEITNRTEDTLIRTSPVSSTLRIMSVFDTKFRTVACVHVQNIQEIVFLCPDPKNN